ncbi:alpha/beta hydrolase [Vibrio diabolicus]
MEKFSIKPLVTTLLLSPIILITTSAYGSEVTRLDDYPIPAAASEVLQGAIKQGYIYPQEITESKPKNDKEWRELIQAINGEGIELEDLEAWFGVDAKEQHIGELVTYMLSPSESQNLPDDRIFLYLHGGAYVFNEGPLGAFEAAIIASTSNIKVVALDYRKPPEHPFPAALDDTILLYKDLLNKYSADKIAIGGNSAGAGLSMAALQKIRDLGLPMPGALYAGSPWADLSNTSDTLHTLDGIDRVLNTYDGWLEASALLYAGDSELTEPYISPVYGSMEEYPPTYLVSGTRDLLLSDTVRVHRKLLKEEIPVDLHIFEGMSHVEFTVVPDSPEGKEVYQGLSDFLDENIK